MLFRSSIFIDGTTQIRIGARRGLAIEMELLQCDLIQRSRGAVAGRRVAVRDGATRDEDGVIWVDVVQ